jgi:SAM-dependent methyltransferase
MPPDRLHEYVSGGFGATPGLYERIRPEYPDAAVDILLRELGIARGRIVVDVGAGTGKLTRMLARTGATVIAVEPLAEMRERLAENVPLAVPFDGTAERMALKDGSAHAITVAQAFHWFDGHRALAEFHRVLAPGARLGLIWNVRDRREPWVDAFDRIVDRVDPDRPDHSTGIWRQAFERSALFGPLQAREVPHAQTLAPSEIVDRAASVSSIASRPEVQRERILDEFRALASTHPDVRGRETVTLPYLTKVYWTERRSPDGTAAVGPL